MKIGGKKSKEFQKSQKDLRRREVAFEDEKLVQEGETKRRDLRSTQRHYASTGARANAAKTRLALDFQRISAQRRAIAHGDDPVIAAREEANAMLDVAAARQMVARLGSKNPHAAILAAGAQVVPSFIRNLNREKMVMPQNSTDRRTLPQRSTGASRRKAAGMRDMRAQNSKDIVASSSPQSPKNRPDTTYEVSDG